MAEHEENAERPCKRQRTEYDQVGSFPGRGKRSLTERTKQSRTIEDAEVDKPELLALPAEIRNTIYELCLVKKKDIVVVNAVIKQPALLQVCKQIRMEDRDIWYMRNDWTVRIYDCDDTLLSAFSRHIDELDLDVEFCYKIQLRGERHWPNLMRWCRNVQKNESVALACDEDDDSHAVIIAAAGDLAYSHIGQGWTACERALDDLRVVVRALDSDWIFDESES